MLSRFIHSTLCISALVQHIAHTYPNWQLCFLNNQGSCVVGILPKTAWQVSGYDDAAGIVDVCIYQRQQLTLCLDRQQRTTYHGWQQMLIDYTQNHATSTPPHNHEQTPSYQEGLMGFIGYDIAANALNHTISIAKDRAAAFMGHYDIYLKPVENSENNKNQGFVLYGVGVSDDLLDKIHQKIQLALNIQSPKNIAQPLTAVWQKHDYQHAFERAQAYLLAGDGYQINLTQAWQGKKTNALAAHLQTLMAMSNAPFGGFIQLTDFELLSVSPELFFTFYAKNHKKHIITKPIKGTRPRSHDPQADTQLKNELANSEKDVAENLMIVDLLRNDLGKYAVIGGVRTPKRFAIESFYNVHHMVSTITAELRDDVHPITVLLDSLPAGSVTGAPKKRACEMIHELEALPRGAYCGTMGFMNFDATGQFNVLIRTLQATNSQVELWAGGGITVGSRAESEYQECFDKVQALLSALSHSS